MDLQPRTEQGLVNGPLSAPADAALILEEVYLPVYLDCFDIRVGSVHSRIFIGYELRHTKYGED